MTLFVDAKKTLRGDWVSNEVRDRLAAPLDEVPSTDPAVADMDVLLAELKASGRALRAALREAVATLEGTEGSVVRLPERASHSTDAQDAVWTEFLRRWADDYGRLTQGWFFQARRTGWYWPQRRIGFDAILPLKASGDEHQLIRTDKAHASAYLTLHIGSGKTASMISLVERIIRKRRVYERQHEIDYIAQLGDNWPVGACKHKDIEPALNIARPGAEGGLLVMLIDFGVTGALSDPGQSPRRGAASCPPSLPAALRRRRNRVLTRAAAPPTPSVVLVVDTSQIPDRPKRMREGGGIGIYMPLPGHLTPASEHACEVQEWWRTAMTACADHRRGGAAI
ncbi:hypothetical protein [Streptomyces sp. NPDC004533]|uniref:hypothetical protein n=1 Tax=Streptomyces sp. NPDC004533 TaxID=3154278 RepID=UPI0033AD649B